MRSVVGTLLAALLVATFASPAVACKGSANLLSGFGGPWVKTYRNENSWDVSDERAIGASNPGYGGQLSYEGAFFPEADVCVDIKMPDLPPTTVIVGGVLIGTADGSYQVMLFSDGRAGVFLDTPDGSLTPVPAGLFDAIKSGEPNTLRVVWGRDRRAAVHINDQPAFEFDLAERGRKLGLYLISEGEQIEFSNLAVTK